MTSAGADRQPLHVLRTEPPPGGPLFLLIHGAGGDHTVWGFQLARLRHAAGLILPDLPGHGRSPGPPRRDIAAMAASLREIVDSAGVRPLFVAGHSMGGAIALQLALELPGRFAGAALIGSAARIAVSQRVLQAIAADAVSAVGMLTQLAYADGTAPEIVEKGRTHLSHCDPETLLADFTACGLFDVRERLGEIEAPVLCLIGGADRLVLPAMLEATASRLRAARTEIVPGAGHLVMIERPDEVNRILEDWMRSPGKTAAPVG